MSRDSRLYSCRSVRTIHFAGALLFALAAWGCSSSEVALTTPSAAKCHVTVATPDTVPAAGGSGSLAVTTTRDCTWAASTSAAWVVMTSVANGQGDGAIAYRIAANSDPSERTATIDVNDTSVAITQAAAECHFTVSPTDASVPPSGGTVTVQVQPSARCGWTAATDADWIHITAGASGLGAGSVTFAVDQNGGGARTAVVTIAGAAVRVSQADSGPPGGTSPPAPAPAPPPAPAPSPQPQPCTYAIQPAGQTVPGSGGTGTIAVTAGQTCQWTAASTAPWLTITAGASGTGNGTVSFGVAPNDGASRSASISVAGQTFTVTQSALACSYSIAPTTEAVTSAGGTLTVTVTAGASCGWVAASNASWITVSAGANGTGNGTVRLAVAANSGTARTGTATIAGQTFTVTQSAAPCTYTLAPSTVDIPAAGGNGTTMVKAGGGCAWTAVANAPWITITSAASGTGDGSVAFAAAANTGAARSGTITIGGQTLTVTQQAPCSFTIAPTSQAVPSSGGSGSVTVTTAAGCTWTAASNNPDWLSVTDPATGNGGGAIMFAAAANTGAARTGTLTIAGRTFTVTQDAPCTFAIAPSAQTIVGAGGNGVVTVTTGPACAWTASSNNPDWLTIMGGASGVGPGMVTFMAAPNPGPDRVGTLTVAGQPFTVTESAP
jgi:hypothetical protein